MQTCCTLRCVRARGLCSWVRPASAMVSSCWSTRSYNTESAGPSRPSNASHGCAGAWHRKFTGGLLLAQILPTTGADAHTASARKPAATARTLRSGGAGCVGDLPRVEEILGPCFHPKGKCYVIKDVYNNRTRPAYPSITALQNLLLPAPACCFACVVHHIYLHLI